jgi:hypothetical protein
MIGPSPSFIVRRGLLSLLSFAKTFGDFIGVRLDEERVRKVASVGLLNNDLLALFNPVPTLNPEHLYLGVLNGLSTPAWLL